MKEKLLGKYEKSIKKYQENFGRPELSFEIKDSGEIKVVLDTENLRLTSVKLEDAGNYHKHTFGNRFVMEFFADGTTRTKEQVDSRVSGWVKRWNEEKMPFSAFKISDNSNDDFIGHVVAGGGDEPNSSELAYLMRQEAWGKKFGTQAVGSVVLEYCPYLKEKNYTPPGYTEFDSLIATSQERNSASCKILGNLGFEVYKHEEKFGAMRNHYELETVSTHDIEKMWSDYHIEVLGEEI